MSGKDERVTSIPICPICGEEPDYWSMFHAISEDEDGGYALVFSKNFLLSEGFNFERLVYYGMRENLDEIVSILCKPKFVGSYKPRHHFARGSETFKRVIKAARRLEK